MSNITEQALQLHYLVISYWLHWTSVWAGNMAFTCTYKCPIFLPCLCNNYNYLLLYQRTWAENGLFLCKCPTPWPHLFIILFKRKPTLMIITNANTMCWWAILRVEIIDTTNMVRCDGHNALSGLERWLEKQ